MLDLIAIWFGLLLSAIVVVKLTEKPSTKMAQKIHRGQHYG